MQTHTIQRNPLTIKMRKATTTEDGHEVHTWQQGGNVITFSLQRETRRFDNLSSYIFLG
jgi:hypothetical protein